MLSRVSSFSGPFARLFKYNNSLETNLILDLQSSIGLSGVSWTDQSGYSNDATLYGTIATASIMNGTTVLSLDGSNDYILPIGGFGNQLDTGFTYEVWASPGTASNGTLLAEWSGEPPTGWNDSQMGFVSNKINVGVYSSVLSSYITGPTFSVNNWYNIVMTYDHLTNIVSLYINGYLFSTVSTLKLNPPAKYLSLGRPDTANTYLGGLSGYFKGHIGSWRIWDGPISGTDILSNYNTNRANYDIFITTNTILYLDAGLTSSYPGTGTTWSDLSVQDNDSTLSNVTYNAGYLTFNGTTSTGLLTSSKYNVVYSGKTIFVSAYLAEHMSNNTYRAFLGSSAGGRNFNFYLNRDVSGNYFLHYSTGASGGFVGGFSSIIALTPGTWFTVAITHTTGGLGTYYFNGVAAGTENYTFSQYLAGSTEHVGRADNFWYGRLGVVAIYKTALSSSEILQNHNSVKSRYGI